jgi:immune inhibitor A
MNTWPKWLVVCLVVVVLLCCFLIVAGSGLAGFAFFNSKTATSTASLIVPTITVSVVTDTPETQVENPTDAATEISPEVTDQPAFSSGAEETLNTLENAIVPNADARDLASRLKGIDNIPETVPDTKAPHQAGENMKFWVLDEETNKSIQIDATLQYVTPHLYFWIENGTRFNQNSLHALADAFENEIYPTDRQFFGSEWTPGIDNDPHLYIIYTKQNLGYHIAGYFSPRDELPPEAYQYSNTHEDFIVEASQKLEATYTYGILAHEFQHMIHWYRDRNEASFLNEGFSELAVYLNGYGAGDKAFLYAEDPDINLTDWPNDPNATIAHYGVAFMYVKYLLDRFGDQTTQAVVGDLRNGLDSIDGVLKDLNVVDPLTNMVIQADDVVADWAVANYLQDPDVGDGRYTYKNYSDVPQFHDTEKINQCPSDWQNRTVNQYGVDYIRINCRGNYNLKFEGSHEVNVLPADPHSGAYAFWSNKGDDSDMTLTQTFDFTGASGPLSMDYWIWYDLEDKYDFTFLEASLNGEDWTILTTPSCTTDNPTGNSYGCGYTGTSNGWVQQTVDLSQYAGKKVQLRFEYITDAAANGEGLLLDDINIQGFNYSSDFEQDNGGWEPNGFVRIQNQLPQTYLVSIIEAGGKTSVKRLPLDANQTLNLPLNLQKDAILVVSGSTRFTRQLANYRISIQP